MVKSPTASPNKGKDLLTGKPNAQKTAKKAEKPKLDLKMQEEDKDGSCNGGNGSGGTAAPGNAVNFRQMGSVSRSFVHKRMARDSFIPKFPDSERGESRQRASFLVDKSDTGTKKRFTEFERMSLSPSMAENSFTKTPRATLESEGLDRDMLKRDDDAKKGSSPDGSSADGGKKGSFYSVMLSKARNRRMK